MDKCHQVKRNLYKGYNKVKYECGSHELSGPLNISIAYVDFGRHIASISYKLLRMAIISHTSTIVSCLIPLVWLGAIIFLHVQMYLLTNCVQCVWDDKLSFYNRSICVPYRNQWDKAHWHSNRVLNIVILTLENFYIIVTEIINKSIIEVILMKLDKFVLIIWLAIS
ncbi:hypothetical protein BLOT_016713 [Blomia tropicalis]|nr:hypothetical protein BLOT_016713 [Blomia tropicalis]